MILLLVVKPVAKDGGSVRIVGALGLQYCTVQCHNFSRQVVSLIICEATSNYSVLIGILEMSIGPVVLYQYI